MKTSVRHFARFLLEHDNYLIYTHGQADADTLGSALALRRALISLGKSAAICNPAPIPQKLRFLFDAENNVANGLPSGSFTHISVDIASYAMLAGFDKECLENLVFDYSVDHHAVNTLRAKNLLVLPQYPAASEIIANTLKALGVEFDKKYALWLYAGISSDSGCFRYSYTRPSTLRLAARLMSTGIDFAKINRLLFDNKTPGAVILEKDAYKNLELFYGGKVALTCISGEALQNELVEDSDADGLNDIPRRIAGVEVSAVIRRRGDEIKVTLRSNDYYDVAALAEKFGGGGHVHAAGCRFYTDEADAKRQILKALEGDFDAG
ncbi:MAG: DHH family phosphoesterase [Clostridia bacterium]|nr:DHH family phosphoesterase [Clostridia bacterium]